MNEHQWTQAIYESSITHLCWCDSAYAQGWTACPAIVADDELRQIVGMERELDLVPEWARLIVVDSLHSLPACGHYLYPFAFLEILESIGSERSQTFVHGCYTVNRERKQAMMDYVLCLDGWLSGAGWQDVARELNALGYRRIDWVAVCADLWDVLGEHDELKDLLVERLILLERWAIKKTAWDDDRAAAFGRDRYLGPYSKTPGRDGVSRWTHADPPVPDFDIHASPRLQRLEARIAELHPRTPIPGWGGDHLYCGWLCAPKAFRYLERILWEIGRGRNVRNGGRVPGFLCCEDTWPDLTEAAVWWHAYLLALDGWWRGQPERGAVADQVHRCLRAPTPVKRWLVRLLWHHLRLAETVWWARWPGEGRAIGKSGTRPLGP